MTADFISSEVKNGSVFLIRGEKGTAIIPSDELESIPTGKLTQIEARLSEKDRKKFEHSLAKYTPYEKISDVDSIEQLNSVWYGRIILNWTGPYKDRTKAVAALGQVAQQIASAMNGEPKADTDEYDTNSDSPTISDDWEQPASKAVGSGKLSTKKPKKEEREEREDYFENLRNQAPRPTDEELIQNIVIEKSGKARGYFAKVQIATIVEATLTLPDVIDKVDTWLSQSGKNYRIFLKKLDSISEYTRYGEVIESWRN